MTWLGLAPGTGPVRPPVSWDSGAITANAPVLTLSQEWNDGAEAFTAFRINVTPTAYAAGSRFLALENSGTAKFVVDGGVDGNYVGLRHPSGEEINIGIIGGSAYGGAITLDRVQAVTTLYTSGGVSFGTINYGARDTGLYRTSAGLLEVNSGTLGAYRDLYVRTLNANTSLILGGSTNKVIYPGTFNGEVGIGNAGGNFFYFNGNTKAIGVYPTGGMRWAASAAVLTGNTTYDTGITRTSAGVLEINSGTASAYRDLTLRSLFAVGGTITASAPGISVTQTWNNGSESFTAMKVNVTATAAASTSYLAEFQTGGTTYFSVRKDGLTSMGPAATHQVQINSGYIRDYFGGSLRATIGLDFAVTLWPTAGLGVNCFLSNNLGLSLGSYTTTATYYVQADSYGAASGDGATLGVRGGRGYALNDAKGGDLLLIGGAGYASATGDAHGGHIYLDGGQAYGTGVDGGIVVGNTRGNLTVKKGLIHEGHVVASINVQTLAATKTIAATDPQVHLLDPDGSDRTVTLPTPTTGLTFTIKNTGGANDLDVEDAGASPVVTIAFGETVTVIYNGSAWVVL